MEWTHGQIVFFKFDRSTVRELNQSLKRVVVMIHFDDRWSLQDLCLLLILYLYCVCSHFWCSRLIIEECCCWRCCCCWQKGKTKEDTGRCWWKQCGQKWWTLKRRWEGKKREWHEALTDWCITHCPHTRMLMPLWPNGIISHSHSHSFSASTHRSHVKTDPKMATGLGLGAWSPCRLVLCCAAPLSVSTVAVEQTVRIRNRKYRRTENT